MKKYSTLVPVAAAVVLLTTLLSAYFLGPLPGALHPDIDIFIHQEQDSSIIEGFLRDIPTSFSVAATNNIGSHLSHRQNIFTIPIGIDKADIVVFLLNDQFAQPSLASQKQMAEKMKHDKNYIEVFKENDFVVFEKRNLYTQKEPIIAKGKLYPGAIESLQHRDFEGGIIHVQKTLATSATTSSFLVSYPSDGLQLFARVDMPIAQSMSQKFPVVIINRGFLSPSAFNEQTSYQNISQAFAAHGYLAITPNYRNNGESDMDSSIAGRLGYPIDVLNLLNSLSTLQQADTKHVFLWGYSIGGQVTLSTLAAYAENTNITATIQAASVWAPVVDIHTAYLQFHTIFPHTTVPYQAVQNAFGSYSNNPIPWESVSPFYYLTEIATPVRIVQSVSDAITPYQWSLQLYNSLKSHQSKTQFMLLQNADHNFTGVWQSTVAADISYFQSFLPIH